MIFRKLSCNEAFDFNNNDEQMIDVLTKSNDIYVVASNVYSKLIDEVLPKARECFKWYDYLYELRKRTASYSFNRLEPSVRTYDLRDDFSFTLAIDRDDNHQIKFAFYQDETESYKVLVSLDPITEQSLQQLDRNLLEIVNNLLDKASIELEEDIKELKNKIESIAKKNKIKDFAMLESFDFETSFDEKDFIIDERKKWLLISLSDEIKEMIWKLSKELNDPLIFYRSRLGIDSAKFEIDEDKLIIMLDFGRRDNHSIHVIAWNQLTINDIKNLDDEQLDIAFKLFEDLKRQMKESLHFVNDSRALEDMNEAFDFSDTEDDPKALVDTSRRYILIDNIKNTIDEINRIALPFFDSLENLCDFLKRHEKYDEVEKLHNSKTLIAKTSVGNLNYRFMLIVLYSNYNQTYKIDWVFSEYDTLHAKMLLCRDILSHIGKLSDEQLEILYKLANEASQKLVDLKKDFYSKNGLTEAFSFNDEEDSIMDSIKQQRDDNIAIYTFGETFKKAFEELAKAERNYIESSDFEEGEGQYPEGTFEYCDWYTSAIIQALYGTVMFDYFFVDLNDPKGYRPYDTAPYRINISATVYGSDKQLEHSPEGFEEEFQNLYTDEKSLAEFARTLTEKEQKDLLAEFATMIKKLQDATPNAINESFSFSEEDDDPICDTIQQAKEDNVALYSLQDKIDQLKDILDNSEEDLGNLKVYLDVDGTPRRFRINWYAKGHHSFFFVCGRNKYRGRFPKDIGRVGFPTERSLFSKSGYTINIDLPLLTRIIDALLASLTSNESFSFSDSDDDINSIIDANKETYVKASEIVEMSDTVNSLWKEYRELFQRKHKFVPKFSNTEDSEKLNEYYRLILLEDGISLFGKFDSTTVIGVYPVLVTNFNFSEIVDLPIELIDLFKIIVNNIISQLTKGIKDYKRIQILDMHREQIQKYPLFQTDK